MTTRERSERLGRPDPSAGPQDVGREIRQPGKCLMCGFLTLLDVLTTKMLDNMSKTERGVT